MHRLSWEEPQDHALTRMDARIKLITAGVLLAMVLTCKAAFFPLFVVVLCLFLCAVMRVPPKRLLVRFSEPAFIVFVLILLKFLLSGQEVLGTVRLFGTEVSGYKDGLIEGLLMGSRIIAAVSVIAVLGFATPFTEFLAALAWLRVPKGLIEVSVFAYRYIFLLFDDAGVIYNAQKNRLGYSNLRRGLSSFGVLAGALTLKAFESSQQTAIAMIQRGYEGKLPLTTQKQAGLAQVLWSALFLMFMGFLWKI